MSKPLDVMLDLETLGTSMDAVIVSIGAVRFSARRVDPRSFYRRVSVTSCLAERLQLDRDTLGWWLDRDTLGWWLDRSPAAMQEVTTGDRVSLRAALTDFAAWIGEEARREVRVWGNDPSFDNAILAHAYRVTDIPQPWRHFNNRCYRTENARAAKLPQIVVRKRGTRHHCLHDALLQARRLGALWRSEQ